MSEQRPDDVLTPGGYRPRSFVQHVSSGDQVRATGAAPPFVEQTRTTGVDGRDSRGRVLTPGGFRHPALVHRIDAGHVIDAASSRLRLLRRDADEVVEVPHVSVQPGDVPGFGTGWITYAYWQNRTGQPVTDFITRWRVPKAPTSSSGQTWACPASRLAARSRKARRHRCRSVLPWDLDTYHGHEQNALCLEGDDTG